jgi:hypothetical protein
MRDNVISAIIDLVELYEVPNLDYYHVNPINREELDLCTDEDLVDILIHIATYEGEDE